MATDRAFVANYGSGDYTVATSVSTGASRITSFQGLKWLCIPVLNIDASASDTVTTGLKGIQVVFWEGDTVDDIAFPQVNAVTGTVTFTGANADCDGRLIIGMKN